MATPDSNQKKRAARIGLIKLAFLKKDDQAIGCLLQDISLTGAHFAFVKLPGIVPLTLAIGDHVQLVVDEVGEAVGTVARLPDGGVALNFDVLNASETAFIEALQAAINT